MKHFKSPVLLHEVGPLLAALLAALGSHVENIRSRRGGTLCCSARSLRLSGYGAHGRSGTERLVLVGQF